MTWNGFSDSFKTLLMDIIGFWKMINDFDEKKDTCTDLHRLAQTCTDLHGAWKDLHSDILWYEMVLWGLGWILLTF